MSKDKWVQCKYRLSFEENSWVARKARDEQVSRNYVIRELIKKEMKNDKNI